MNSKVGKIDKYVWPNSCHQLVFGHQLTWPFDQGKQMSMARLLSATGLSPSRRRCCEGSRRNDPNKISGVASIGPDPVKREADGQPALLVILSIAFIDGQRRKVFSRQQGSNSI